MGYCRYSFFIGCLILAVALPGCKTLPAAPVKYVEIQQILGSKFVDAPSLVDGSADTTWTQETNAGPVTIQYCFESPAFIEGFRLHYGKQNQDTQYARVHSIESFNEGNGNKAIFFEDTSTEQTVLLAKPFIAGHLTIRVSGKNVRPVKRLAIAELVPIGRKATEKEGLTPEKAAFYEKAHWARGDWVALDGPGSEAKMTLRDNGICSGTYYDASSGLSAPIRCQSRIEGTEVEITATYSVAGETSNRTWRIDRCGRHSEGIGRPGSPNFGK